ncbi:MAG: hypothetical protein LBT04_10235 [Prevotellaceae bacterium]|jgi:SanA protein|nr:hypothetical protein [Prevotellaceae bacterium]
MRKKLKYLIILCAAVIVAIVFICDNVIRNSSKKFVFSDIDKIQYNKVGLLLGTSKYLKSGQIN